MRGLPTAGWTDGWPDASGRPPLYRALREGDHSSGVDRALSPECTPPGPAPIGLLDAVPRRVHPRAPAGLPALLVHDHAGIGQDDPDQLPPGPGLPTPDAGAGGLTHARPEAPAAE